MFRYAAFHRAINVGGHTVKMDVLKKHFEDLGFSDVETFIASGNVVFSSASKNVSDLEKKIEVLLNKSLGYEVATFIRPTRELPKIASHPAFKPAELKKAKAYNVAFVKNTLDQTATGKLMALENKIDRFHIHEREIYWLCAERQSDSKFSNKVLEKTIGQSATIRGLATIEKMAAKYS